VVWCGVLYIQVFHLTTPYPADNDYDNNDDDDDDHDDA
jgi:hypothetical protein